MEREKYLGLDVYTIEEFEEMLTKGQTDFYCMRIVGEPNSFLPLYSPYPIFIKHCSFKNFLWKIFGKMYFDKCDFEDVEFIKGRNFLDFSQCSLLGCSFLDGIGDLEFKGSTLSAVKIKNMNLKCFQCTSTQFNHFEFEDNLTDKTVFKISNCAFESPIWISCKDFEQAAMEQTNKIPTDGSFIAWKKAMITVLENCYYPFPVLVKLEIPADAKRVGTSTSGKYRANKAKVLAITSIEEDEEYQEAHSWYDSNFKYKVGETVEVNNFDSSPFKTCTIGIHFFLNKEMAKNYNI